jgi:hypothetical protein
MGTCFAALFWVLGFGIIRCMVLAAEKWETINWTLISTDFS